jgi:hypothetical protein
MNGSTTKAKTGDVRKASTVITVFFYQVEGLIVCGGKGKIVVVSYVDTENGVLIRTRIDRGIPKQ